MGYIIHSQPSSLLERSTRKDAGNTFVWGGDTVIGERGEAAIVENNNIALHMLEDLHFQGQKTH